MILIKPSREARKCLAFFAKPVLDQVAQGVESLPGFGAFGRDRDTAARTGSQHHKAHDRGAADSHIALGDGDLRVELFGELDETCRCPGMQAAFVFFLDDGGLV